MKKIGKGGKPKPITAMQRSRTQEPCRCGYEGPSWDDSKRCAHCGGIRKRGKTTRYDADLKAALAREKARGR